MKGNFNHMSNASKMWHCNSMLFGIMAKCNTLHIISVFSEYIVGFNRTAYMGTEGGLVEVCIDTMAGTLQSGVTLAYLVGAPREDATQPAGSMADTAMGMSCYISCCHLCIPVSPGLKVK